MMKNFHSFHPLQCLPSSTGKRCPIQRNFPFCFYAFNPTPKSSISFNSINLLKVWAAREREWQQQQLAASTKQRAEGCNNLYNEYAKEKWACMKEVKHEKSLVLVRSRAHNSWQKCFSWFPLRFFFSFKNTLWSFVWLLSVGSCKVEVSENYSLLHFCCCCYCSYQRESDSVWGYFLVNLKKKLFFFIVVINLSIPFSTRKRNPSAFLSLFTKFMINIHTHPTTHTRACIEGRSKSNELRHKTHKRKTRNCENVLQLQILNRNDEGERAAAARAMCIYFYVWAAEHLFYVVPCMISNRWRNDIKAAAAYCSLAARYFSSPSAFTFLWIIELAAAARF
jgi:hypothetical protein